MQTSMYSIQLNGVQGCMSSTVGVEKRTNVRLSKSKEEFETIMKNLELPYPKKIGTRLVRFPVAMLVQR